MQRLDLEIQETFLEEGTNQSCEALTEIARQAQTSTSVSVSLEAEIPEVLFKEMKKFIGSNQSWDQYTLLSSAMASFLFQNGCRDRAVTERYLNDLFSRTRP